MAIKIRSANDIAAKFSRVTPGRASEYTAGIQDTSPQQFESAAIAAEDIYAQAVQESINRRAREKALRGSGEKWQRKASTQGPGRFAQGTAAAADAYTEGFEPYRATIAALTLPARGPAGAPGNIERVRAVAEALRAKKVAG